jgi:hypothetical protein
MFLDIFFEESGQNLLKNFAAKNGWHFEQN